jgi:hypothetical protein
MKYLEIHVQAGLYTIVWVLLLVYLLNNEGSFELFYASLYQLFAMIFFGTWQLVSTIIRSIITPYPSKSVVVLNLWVAGALLLLFTGLVVLLNSKIFEASDNASNIFYLIVGLYNLLVNIAAIRYWLVLRRYYANH